MQTDRIYELYARMIAMGGWVGQTQPVFEMWPTHYLEIAMGVLDLHPFLYKHLKERRNTLRELVSYIEQETR